jgi:glycosyltransferase involved in cell wall biosynthesis
MKILFIAPLAPPINGQSLQSKIFFDYLIKNNEIILIDTMKDSCKDGIDSFKRIVDVLKILVKVYKRQKNADVVYLHISESLGGNLRDLFIFFICYKKLKNIYIHLHGGSIKIWVYDKIKILFRINKFFIKKIGGVIVLGNSHIQIFENMIEKSKIHVVPNFAEDYIFSNPEKIKEKFSNMQIVRVLFMSNLIKGKGYFELLEGYTKLDLSIRQYIHLDFAGAFGSYEDKIAFLNKASVLENVKYHGVVNGSSKKMLFDYSHILCFPSYLFEGQGICLIEGYASGCVGMTTGKSGIRDIFVNNVNGFQIEERNPDSIAFVLKEIFLNKNCLLNIALNNYYEALNKYTVVNHCQNLSKLL